MIHLTGLSLALLIPLSRKQTSITMIGGDRGKINVCFFIAN
jgi:hypothetical protein